MLYQTFALVFRSVNLGFAHLFFLASASLSLRLWLSAGVIRFGMPLLSEPR
jgi:hypothetical protein